MKTLLLWVGVDVQKVHDVGRHLAQYRDLFTDNIRNHMADIQKISRELRKDRELAFYGMNDWIPLNEYTQEDAQDAIERVEYIFHLVKGEILG